MSVSSRQPFVQPWKSRRSFSTKRVKVGQLCLCSKARFQGGAHMHVNRRPQPDLTLKYDISLTEPQCMIEVELNVIFNSLNNSDAAPKRRCALYIGYDSRHVSS